MAKKIWLGALFLIILTASFYILLPGKVRIDFTKTRTIFKVYEDDKFVTSGIEYTRIFDGTTKMRAKSRSISYDIKDNTTKWYRLAKFKQNITVEDFVYFSNLISDVRSVPISHLVCFTNANGKIFEYLISNIKYDGITKDIISPFSFEMNMKVTFEEGYYRAKIYQQKVRPDKIIIRYRISKDYECFDIRLFDPEKEELDYEYIYENLSRQVPVYIYHLIQVPPTYNAINDTWSKPYNYTKRTLDYYKTEYYQGKRIGVKILSTDSIKEEYKGKTYISRNLNVNEKEGYLYICDVSVGDRNWPEYPMRQFEIDKGVCRKINFINELVK